MAESDSMLEFRCSVAARWLPRATAAAVVVLASLIAVRFTSDHAPGAATVARAVIWVAGFAIALWVLRNASEVGLRLRLEGRKLHFRHARGSVSLEIDEIESLLYASPFAASSHWLPAAVLVDRWGRRWRLSALLDQGGRLIEEIVQRHSSDSIATWAEARQIPARMRHARRNTAIGYLSALALIIAGQAWL